MNKRLLPQCQATTRECKRCNNYVSVKGERNCVVHGGLARPKKVEQCKLSQCSIIASTSGLRCGNKVVDMESKACYVHKDSETLLTNDSQIIYFIRNHIPWHDLFATLLQSKSEQLQQRHQSQAITWLTELSQLGTIRELNEWINKDNDNYDLSISLLSLFGHSDMLWLLELHWQLVSKERCSIFQKRILENIKQCKKQNKIK